MRIRDLKHATLSKNLSCLQSVAGIRRQEFYSSPFLSRKKHAPLSFDYCEPCLGEAGIFSEHVGLDSESQRDSSGVWRHGSDGRYKHIVMLLIPAISMACMLVKQNEQP